MNINMYKKAQQKSCSKLSDTDQGCY
jgi:hypothetical protein